MVSDEAWEAHYDALDALNKPKVTKIDRYIITEEQLQQWECDLQVISNEWGESNYRKYPWTENQAKMIDSIRLNKVVD